MPALRISRRFRCALLGVLGIVVGVAGDLSMLGLGGCCPGEPEVTPIVHETYVASAADAKDLLPIEIEDVQIDGTWVTIVAHDEDGRAFTLEYKRTYHGCGLAPGH